MSRSKDSLLTLPKLQKPIWSPNISIVKRWNESKIKRALTNFSVKMLILSNFPIKVHQVNDRNLEPTSQLAFPKSTK